MAGYGTDQGLTDWLVENGLSLPSGAPAPAVLRNRGAAYVDSTYGARLTCGQRQGGAEQERAWPRTGHPNVSAGVIPLAWVHASYRAAYLHATTPGGLSRAIDANQRVQKEKVDVIEQTFFDNGSVKAGKAVGLLDAEIDGMVAPFLCKSDYEIGMQII